MDLEYFNYIELVLKIETLDYNKNEYLLRPNINFIFILNANNKFLKFSWSCQLFKEYVDVYHNKSEQEVLQFNKWIHGETIWLCLKF